jgi:UDP-N-acetylmuramate dehydrogenase
MTELTIPDRPKLKMLVDSPMSMHTTWRIGGPADFLVRVPEADDLVAVARWAKCRDLPLTVIGGGSNLLAGDRGIRGVVALARTPGERAGNLVSVEDLGDAVLFSVGAQAPLSWVGRYASERGWAGLDWAVGLPGVVGGAAVNNAGAHGTEFKDALVSVMVLNDRGEVEIHDRDWVAPRYRMTRMKEAARPRPWHVLAVQLRLPKDSPESLTRLSDEHAAFRKASQPTGACAGSTFANPPGDFAGRLLEAAGMKGFAVGPVSFSAKHSNFIVNAGKGTASQVRELIEIGRTRVREAFGVELETEIEEIGER